MSPSGSLPTSSASPINAINTLVDLGILEQAQFMPRRGGRVFVATEVVEILAA